MQGDKDMFCNKCGSQVEDGQVFCGKCGSPVGQATDPVSNYVNNQPYGQQPYGGMPYGQQPYVQTQQYGAYPAQPTMLGKGFALFLYAITTLIWAFAFFTPLFGDLDEFDREFGFTPSIMGTIAYFFKLISKYSDREGFWSELFEGMSDGLAEGEPGAYILLIAFAGLIFFIISAIYLLIGFIHLVSNGIRSNYRAASDGLAACFFGYVTYLAVIVMIIVAASKEEAADEVMGILSPMVWITLSLGLVIMIFTGTQKSKLKNF